MVGKCRKFRKMQCHATLWFFRLWGAKLSRIFLNKLEIIDCEFGLLGISHRSIGVMNTYEVML